MSQTYAPTCSHTHTHTYVHCCVRNQHIAVRRQRHRRRRRRQRRSRRRRIGHQTAELLTVFQPLHRWQRQPAGHAATDLDATADLHANRLRLQRELFSDVWRGRDQTGRASAKKWTERKYELAFSYTQSIIVTRRGFTSKHVVLFFCRCITNPAGI